MTLPHPARARRSCGGVFDLRRALLRSGAAVGFARRPASSRRRTSSRTSRSEIKRHRAKSSELQKKETDVAKQLSYLDKEIALATKYLSGLKKREALLTQQIDSLRADLVVESDVLTRERDRLARRLRQMYMQGAVENEWEFILGGENVAEKLRRYKFMRMIAERDAGLVDRGEHSQTGARARTGGAHRGALRDRGELRIVQETETEELKKSKDARVSRCSRRSARTRRRTKRRSPISRSRRRQLKDLIGELERKRVGEKEPTGTPAGRFRGAQREAQAAGGRPDHRDLRPVQTPEVRDGDVQQRDRHPGPVGRADPLGGGGARGVRRLDRGLRKLYHREPRRRVLHSLRARLRDLRARPIRTWRRTR